MTDFLFQEYHRNGIEEEDILQILRKLLECGWASVNGRIGTEKNALTKRWIQLHVGTVKNQLIFAFSAWCPDAIPIKKKEFRPWIKKYAGVLEINRENETLEILLGLTCVQHESV